MPFRRNRFFFNYDFVAGAVVDYYLVSLATTIRWSHNNKKAIAKAVKKTTKTATATRNNALIPLCSSWIVDGMIFPERIGYEYIYGYEYNNG